MPSYTATDNVNDLNELTPAGNNNPNELDDAIRESKLVLKTVIGNAMTGKGELKIAVAKHRIAADTGSPAANNAWHRRPLSILSDPCTILSAGDYTNTIKPQTGVYLVQFYANGLKLNQFQARFAQATGNTTSPSAASELSDLLGAVVRSQGTDLCFSASIGFGILTTDGTKSYCLDQIHASANTTDGWGQVGTSGWTSSNFSFPAGVTLIKLATTI